MLKLGNFFYLILILKQSNLENIINEELTKFNNLCNKLIKLNSTSNHSSFPTLEEIE